MRGERLKSTGVFQPGRRRALARLRRSIRGDPQDPVPGFDQGAADRGAHLARMQQTDSRVFHDGSIVPHAGLGMVSRRRRGYSAAHR